MNGHLIATTTQTDMKSYQKQFVEDNSRIKLLVHARKVGGTYAAYEQAKLLLQEGEKVLWVNEKAFRSVKRDQKAEAASGVFLCKSTEMVIAEYEERQIRGSSAHVILDSVQDCPSYAWKKILKAVYDVISETWSKPNGYRLIITGIPTSEMMDDLLLVFGMPSTHVVSINYAVSLGCPRLQGHNPGLNNDHANHEIELLSEWENYNSSEHHTPILFLAAKGYIEKYESVRNRWP